MCDLSNGWSFLDRLSYVMSLVSINRVPWWSHFSHSPLFLLLLCPSGDQVFTISREVTTLSSSSAISSKMYEVVDVSPFIDVFSSDSRSPRDTMVSFHLSSLVGERGVGTEDVSPFVRIIAKGEKLDEARIHNVEYK
ncbi:hypothetical protein VNO80_25379 [Phaseolus coccineus]|uniref:Uncharacterized protein n=1 Tax=Phaseolus coccineus TaxID=3886 RepID=A0AAN9LZ36_PHACN